MAKPDWLAENPRNRLLELTHLCRSAPKLFVCIYLCIEKYSDAALFCQSHARRLGTCQAKMPFFPACCALSLKGLVRCFGKTFPAQVLWAFGQINIGRISHVVCVFKNPMWFQSGAGKYLWKFWRTTTRIHVSKIWSCISIRQSLSAQWNDEIDWGLLMFANKSRLLRHLII